LAPRPRLRQQTLTTSAAALSSLHARSGTAAGADKPITPLVIRPLE
jgi:hypothetical protein